MKKVYFSCIILFKLKFFSFCFTFPSSYVSIFPSFFFRGTSSAFFAAVVCWLMYAGPTAHYEFRLGVPRAHGRRLRLVDEPDEFWHCPIQHSILLVDVELFTLNGKYEPIGSR